MSKLSFIVLLVLGVVVTYGVSILDFGFGSASTVGFPLKFSSISLFSTSTTNLEALALDIIFWFFVLWAIWLGIRKLKKS